MHLAKFDAIVRSQTDRAASHLHRMHGQYLDDGRALDIRLQQSVRELVARCEQDYHDRLARLARLDGLDHKFEAALRSDNSWEVACQGVDAPLEA